LTTILLLVSFLLLASKEVDTIDPADLTRFIWF